tara:strand:- start:7320 stop:8345 length:1026 start_codon:yes stop_codon:yes gene_type:complete
MAFLDNSGDIILDAVLTDIGRKRMARGNFKITKFSIGDDEIDYGLYNKNHPSGSAYYDLEILQTPVLEAFTQANANINYGLVSYPRQDLLYIPSALLNEKSFNSRIAQRSASKNVFFLADDTKTTVAGVTTSKTMTSVSSVPEANVLISGQIGGRMILIETGIETTDLAASSANQGTYIASVGLADRSFMVRYDRRFIGGTFGPGPNSTFSNSSTAGANLNISLQRSSTNRQSTDLMDYNVAVINASLTRVYSDFTTGTTTMDTSTNYSVITGPRGVFTALNFGIRGDITQTDYSKFGTTSNDLFGDGTLYDFIDTTIYVQGVATNATVQLPIRIIKLAQT